jgi:biotin transport system substrate-specific component
MVGPTGGYLVGFLLSAYPAAVIYEKKLSWLRALLTIILSQMIIFSLGMAWLSVFVGIIPAYTMGVAPFLMGSFIKSLMSLALVFPLEKIRSFLREIN